MTDNFIKCMNCGGKGLLYDDISEPSECMWCQGNGVIQGEYCIRCDELEDPQFLDRHGYCENCHGDMFDNGVK